MMKKVLSIAVFSLLFMSIVHAQDIVGNYERERDFMSNPTVLMLKSDGQFEIVTGATSIVGTYSYAGGNVVFTDVRGNYADITAGKGSYHAVIIGTKLSFKTINDRAIQRKDVLIGSTWKKVGKID